MQDDLATARLAAIVDSSDDAIIGKTLDGTITAWNAAAERLFGYTAEEVVGANIALLEPPGRQGETRELLARISRGERVERLETQRCRRDGSLLEISLTVSPILDNSGRIVGASKIARDVSEQKRLSAQRGLLAAIVSSSDDAIVSKNLDGIITSWNAAAERLLGYSAEEIIGRHISTIAPPGRAGEMTDIIEKIRRGERVEHFETQRQRKDGSLVDISLTVSPIYDDSGRVIGASKIARDISERRRADERLRLLMRELDHRAKNVLAVAQAMLRLTSADSVPDYVNAVEGRIRALARVHSRVAESSWSGADIRALVAADIEVFSDAGGRMRAEGDSVWVSPAAAQVIAIVLHELSTNAAKYGALSNPEGSVAIEWHRDSGGDLRLSWSEERGPVVAEPRRRGFGTQIIERGIPDQLGGRADVTWAPTGFRCSFVVPAAHVVDGARRAASAR
jgi:PAS domain S-box-containing protein